MRDRPPHVLIAYGSTRGGTREIAETIAEVMLNEGIDVELADAADVRSLDGYDAVIIGGALYMNRWHRDARKLLTHHALELRATPVWLFSSGPLDGSANAKDLPPTGQVTHLMERIGARGHVMFGGRLEPDAKGFPAAQMAKKMAGDWREWHKVRAWARETAKEILDEQPRPVVIIPTPSKTQRWLLAALCWFVGLTAIGGGLTLALRPDGSLMEATPAMLQHSPFGSFLVPGLLLFIVIGLGSALAGFVIVSNARLAPYFAFFAGAALLVWITAEMILLRSHHWLQVGYLTVATVILIEAWKVFELPWRHGRAAGYAARQLS